MNDKEIAELREKILKGIALSFERVFWGQSPFIS